MHRRLVTLIAATATALACVAATLGLTVPAAASKTTYVAPLSGAQEVAPVDTNATGVAVIHSSKRGAELSYRLNVANIEDVLMAHIHLAPRGENGDVVAWLYPSAPPPELIPGRTDGVLATGTVTDDDLVGPLEGMTVADLIAEIEAGNAYVNVHTRAHGGGEIRGQIR